jgi:3',5'-cyclic-AMP phosphodiesterase
MILIAQVTDTHIVDPASGRGAIVDHVDRLAEAIERINAEDPPVDLVVLTGDLTDGGGESENRLLIDLLDAFERPVVGVPGNHDRRETFPDRLLPGGRPEHGHLSWVLDDHPVRVVGLDTTEPGHHGGVFDGERRDWLEQVLAAEPDRPTMVVMHHPPFATGIEWMDREGYPGADLRAVLDDHRQVGRVVCGHLHRPVLTSFDHALVTVAPATVHQVACDLRPRSDPQLVLDPAGYQLHRWSEGLWVTHTRYIATGQEPFTPEWA